MQKKCPIGFFDSGYGGLTVLKEVQKVLPAYDYLYLGDNLRAPYGTRSQETVYNFTWQCVQTLFDYGCELIILACNTASAKALRKMQQNDLLAYPEKRVLGVIRPSAETVGSFSQSNHITILGTEGTISSNTYLDEFETYSPTTIVHQQACPNWVPLIEQEAYKTKEGQLLIKQEVEQIIAKFPLSDVLLLGCTHYPILQTQIEQLIPPSIKVVSQGEIVAKSLADYLQRHKTLEKKLTKHGETGYFTTGDPENFKSHASSIIGIDIDEVVHLTIKK